MQVKPISEVKVFKNKKNIFVLFKSKYISYALWHMNIANIHVENSSEQMCHKARTHSIFYSLKYIMCVHVQLIKMDF